MGVSPVALVWALVLWAGCRGGCGAERAERDRIPALLGRLPAEAEVVVGIDFSRLRKAPLWPKLASLGAGDPGDLGRIQEFARRTGLDPLSQIDSLLLAFPEQARQRGEMALVLRAHGMDQARLLAYARDQVARDGEELFSFERAGQTLWATRAQPTTAAFFIGGDTVVVGAGGWAEKMADLLRAPQPAGPATNATLAGLVARAGPRRGIWAAAIVPAATRAELGRNPDFAAAAGIDHVAASLDMGADVEVQLVTDLGSRAEAEALARRVGAAVQQAKRSPQVLLLGVGPQLDGVRARADGVSCEITVKISGPDAVELTRRLQAFLKLTRPPVAPRP